tara:strand:- start:44 stop:343 length:300 start_codon:yes stop_codon:yes gene_type:complete
MNDYYQKIKDMDNFKEVHNNSKRDVYLTDQETHLMLNEMIPRTLKFISRNMYRDHELDIEFINNFRYWVDYDHHVSQKQLDKFFILFDKTPEYIESGLL